MHHFSQKLSSSSSQRSLGALAPNLPGLEFVRPVLPESKLVRDAFACLASEHQEQKQERKGLWGWAESRVLGTTMTRSVLAPPQC